MPLFKSNSQRRASPSPTRRRNASPSRSGRTSSDSRSGSSNNPDRRSSGGGGLFSRNKGFLDHDPTIVAAHQKIADAERAERDADNALMQARKSAQAARDHVKILEREALEDARRAKAKQAEVKVINKTARGLGH